MYAGFDFESNKTSLRINRPDLVDKQSVLDELTAEWYNMMLFASEDTLESLRRASAMRKDLGRGSVSIEI